MFELELSNNGSKDDRGFVAERLNVFKKIIEGLSDFVEQMEIVASNKGLAIQVMDSIHVAFVDVFLSHEMFSTYRCDRDTRIGLPVKHFLTILRGIVPDEGSLVRFSCDDSPQTLRIEHALAGSKFQSDITLYQINIDNFCVPRIDYNGVVKMPSEQFRSISKMIGSFGDHICLKGAQDEFTFELAGDLINNVMKLTPVEGSVSVDFKTKISARVATKYINMLNKFSALSNDITVRLNEASPVLFEIQLYNTLGHVRLYVAPSAEEHS